ncbi:hypothetical protein [Lapidilactobacillus luobeiensis]|uniref:hypothetical protein n=1 Tax=Lapidilactobacillus luobeiensis TaxID=2950371 RepID=UPI0021C39713|nr:hypothetical protein [Lapidilactobacillus luobeiensis]
MITMPPSYTLETLFQYFHYYHHLGQPLDLTVTTTTDHFMLLDEEIWSTPQASQAAQQRIRSLSPAEIRLSFTLDEPNEDDHFRTLELISLPQGPPLRFRQSKTRIWDKRPLIAKLTEAPTTALTLVDLLDKTNLD